jgi:peroxiredoxin
MTTKSAARREQIHRSHAQRNAVLAAGRQADHRRTQRRRIIISAAIILVLAGIITAMMLSSRPTSTSTTRVAPDFTLADTTGQQVHLADLRGHNVVLYFNEGAGCGACLQQMTSIEQNKAAFDGANITVLPIVMNTREQITADMTQYGVTTPFLLDDGTVSRAYDTLGHGMHAGLPGHGFVLIDSNGIQQWKGEYPSMWLAPNELLDQVTQHLPA